MERGICSGGARNFFSGGAKPLPFHSPFPFPPLPFLLLEVGAFCSHPLPSPSLEAGPLKSS